MPTYTYSCVTCGGVTDGFYKLTETRPEELPCSECGNPAEYTLAAPMVLKASFLDGQRSKQWKDVREASKLNKLAAQTDNLQAKKEIKQEAAKIGYKFSNDPD